MQQESGMGPVERMIGDIEAETRYTKHMTGLSSLDPRVLEVMAEVPRHRFVPQGMQDQAYYNGPLPIGHGQTISQPFIVALMTELLKPRISDQILEVGTGSGYQAAVLSRLVRRVYSLEVVESLSISAAGVLVDLGYDNVECIYADGYEGLPEHAPYDGIIVTAAATEIPPPLIRQLKPGGRLVIPVGERGFHQDLMVLTKDAEGKTELHYVLGVAFVPLTGVHADSTFH
jgi:protein-L-isoaspartate(D-aspartate) O-methyltransferase